MSRRYAAAIVSVLLLTLPAARSAAGQAIRLAVYTEVEQAPVSGAVVTLLDGDVTVDEGLTTVTGERTLRAVRPGTYRVRVRRIGFAPHLSGPVTLTADETRPLRLEVASRRVTLPPVVVESREKQCARGDRRSIAAASLWEQVATALTASEISRADSLVRTRVQVFERTRATNGHVAQTETRHLGTGDARPFVTPPPAELSDRGYVLQERPGADIYFYAPDARVLLSAEFEADHCFRVVRGMAAREGMLGLAFTPVADRKVVDIAGTLWVSPATLELRTLDFRYVGARFPDPAPLAGGRVEFERLPSGAWLVRHWVITMPRYAARGRSRRPRLTGYVEHGGEAAPITGTLHAGEPQPARITGIVWDSLQMRPLAGASVWSQTAARTTTAGADGAFVLDSLQPGEHLLVAASPRLDTVGLQIARVVEATPSGMPPVALASPSLATVSARLCGSAAAVPPGTGILFGAVREATTGALVANALVEVSWLRLGTDSTRLDADIAMTEPRSDSTGAYAACGVPVDATLHVTAHSGDSVRSGTVYLEVGALRIARRDLVTAPLLASGGALRGAVVDSAGRPLESVSVAIDGAAEEARTTATGEFLLSDAPLGTRTLIVRRPGFAPVYAVASLTPRDTPYVRIEMSTARLLGAVEVRAERVSRTLSEVARRRRTGTGHFLDAASARALPNFQALFRAFPAVRVIQLPGGDFRLTGPGRSLGGGACPLTLFIDGRRAATELLLLYPLKSVVAVEVYPRGSQVPSAFQPFTNGCGAALVWTEELG